MTHVSLLGDTRPLSAHLYQPIAKFGIEVQSHGASIAKFYDTRKQHFATRRGKTSWMQQPPVRRPANLVLCEALAYFMGEHWTNVSLARASGVSEGTIRNYLAPQKRDQGASGKAPSAKLAELDKIAAAMGLQITDLLADLSADERAALYRRRAAECYQRTGVLPEWAPSTAAPAAPTEPTTASGLPVSFVERRHAPAPPPFVERRRGVTVYTHPQADDPDVFPPRRPKSAPKPPSKPGKPSTK